MMTCEDGIIHSFFHYFIHSFLLLLSLLLFASFFHSLESFRCYHLFVADLLCLCKSRPRHPQVCLCEFWGYLVGLGTRLRAAPIREDPSTCSSTPDCLGRFLRLLSSPVFSSHRPRFDRSRHFNSAYPRTSTLPETHTTAAIPAFFQLSFPPTLKDIEPLLACVTWLRNLQPRCKPSIRTRHSSTTPHVRPIEPKLWDWIELNLPHGFSEPHPPTVYTSRVKQTVSKSCRLPKL